MPLWAFAIVLIYVRTFFITITQLWVPLNRWLGWLMLPLGQASLFTFTMHLVAISFLYNIPGIGDFEAEDLSRLMATVAGVYYMSIIFGAVKLRQYLRTQVYPRTEAGRGFLRHIPSVHAISAGVAFLAATFIFTEPTWDTFAFNYELFAYEAWDFEEDWDEEGWGEDDKLDQDV